jgi:hypothetical protein
LTKTPTPKISGLLKVGITIKATPGTWDTGTSFTYQWLRDGVSIAKATSSSYKLTAKDKAHKLSVRVTGKKTGYTSISKTSLASKVS